jgi:1-acyl-sn-glycerol-3-phosphate acyltransferase
MAYKYKILLPIVKLITKIYVRPEYEGLDNIPKDGAFILAGNHIHLLDPGPIMNSTNREIHFLAKASLFKLPQSLIFNHLGLIPVNRDGKDGAALDKAIEYLKNGEVVGIYPEGTRERGRGVLPFKMGVVKMAKETNTVIIPFATIGRYRPFRKGLKVKFGKPYKVGSNLEKSNEELRKIIKKLVEE